MPTSRKTLEIFRKRQIISKEAIFKLFGLFNLGEAEKLDRCVNYIELHFRLYDNLCCLTLSHCGEITAAI